MYDGLSIPIAWYMAHWLRYNLHPYPSILTAKYSFYALCLLSVVQIGCYFYYKTYRGLWRFASLSDLIRILKAVATAVVLVIPILYSTLLLHHVPRVVIPLYAVILTTLLCGARLLARVHWDKKSRSVVSEETHKNVLIIGAGLAGESLARDLLRGKFYHLVGFVDDNLTMSGLEVHGVKVLGGLDSLSKFVKAYQVDLIFIAIPSARAVTMRRIVSCCEQTKVAFRTLPSIADLALGRVDVNALRPVNLEDLLGRDEVSLQWDKIADEIVNKRVLITGGGGSIGSELCRQVLALSPESLSIVDSCEFNLFQIEQELLQLGLNIPIDVYLINVVDKIAINQLFSSYKPHIVFHAAAYKHVPMLQKQVRAAVFNNVLGTEVVAKASFESNVYKFILISTDKAVNPTSIMGCTKRVAEIYCQNLNAKSNTQFITVRFGNVLGSTGSVIPLFQKQLQKGGPLTVTHKDMERYFMTIPEAAQLILQATTNSQGGEIFVLDMGEPVKISYLAEQMIRLAGKEPNKDINIEYTGLRPGEKLFEELFHAEEQLTPTHHQKVFAAKTRMLSFDEVNSVLNMMRHACMENQTDELLILLKNLVPELKLEELAEEMVE